MRLQKIITQDLLHTTARSRIDVDICASVIPILWDHATLWVAFDSFLQCWCRKCPAYSGGKGCWLWLGTSIFTSVLHWDSGESWRKFINRPKESIDSLQILKGKQKKKVWTHQATTLICKGPYVIYVWTSCLILKLSQCCVWFWLFSCLITWLVSPMSCYLCI